MSVYLKKLPIVLMILLGSIFSSGAYAKKTIGIIVFDGVLTSDVTAPIEVFGVASKKSWFTDYEVVVINVGKEKEVETYEGLRMLVDSSISDSPKVDVLLVPSTYDMDPLLNNSNLISYIQDTAKQADWMASNCSGAFLLAKSGILDGKKATTWFGGEKELKDSFPSVKVQFDKNYVVDNKVITSNGGLVSYQAALALLSEIASPSKADEVAEALQYQRISHR